MKKISSLLVLFMVLIYTGFGQTVKIGTQVWSSKNLDVSAFRNGDAIPEAKTDAEWERAGENKQPAWCYYNNDPANGLKYGKLYNWYAVSDPRGLAPVGYHIPSWDDWNKLIEHLGGDSVAGKKMKSSSGWFENGSGTNSSGFAGLPGGYRYEYGTFTLIDRQGYWWSTAEMYSNFAWYRFLNYRTVLADKFYNYKEVGISVRCLKD